MRTTKKKELAPSSKSVFVCVCGFVVLFFLSAMSALLSPPPPHQVVSCSNGEEEEKEGIASCSIDDRREGMIDTYQCTHKT